MLKIFAKRAEIAIMVKKVSQQLAKNLRSNWMKSLKASGFLLLTRPLVEEIMYTFLKNYFCEDSLVSTHSVILILLFWRYNKNMANTDPNCRNKGPPPLFAHCTWLSNDARI